jgi:hypothetical protein
LRQKTIWDRFAMRVKDVWACGYFFEPWDCCPGHAFASTLPGKGVPHSGQIPLVLPVRS